MGTRCGFRQRMALRAHLRKEGDVWILLGFSYADLFTVGFLQAPLRAYS